MGAALETGDARKTGCERLIGEHLAVGLHSGGIKAVSIDVEDVPVGLVFAPRNRDAGGYIAGRIGYSARRTATRF